MLKLLREHEVASAFKAARRNGGQASVAVAFWGKGGAAKLGLKGSEDARVICNLDQVGCNPEAIKELRDLGIQVKTHPRLHAKIYATPAVVIIGSSNASTNGLTVEGDGALGWKEANVMTDDAMMIAGALSYFDELWDDPEARRITPAEIKTALARPRATALALLDPPRAKTLIAACRERPEAFEKVIIYPYIEPLSDEAEERLADFRRRAKAPAPGSNEPNFRNAWGYEDGNIPKDVWIVDLDCKPGKPKVWGCSQSVGAVLELDDGGCLTITPRGNVTIGDTRYKISQEEKYLLEAAGRQLLRASKHDYVTLPQAVQIADRVAGTTLNVSA
jgi:hypothetical protein